MTSSACEEEEPENARDARGRATLSTATTATRKLDRCGGTWLFVEGLRRLVLSGFGDDAVALAVAEYAELQLGASTIWAILTKAGVGPAPWRAGPTWTECVTAQARGMLASQGISREHVS
ncbi:hypothetical protein ACNAW0_27335 [Micromonospora sp. SL1-18]|uniref:hypothetical protein n=1 Tax=Micromonospora sp. SL1-18 TaxID=3399128 RepID=UPI003A4DD17C